MKNNNMNMIVQWAVILIAIISGSIKYGNLNNNVDTNTKTINYMVSKLDKISDDVAYIRGRINKDR